MDRVVGRAGDYSALQRQNHSGIADIIQPLSITTAGVSDANGTITFTFPSIPVSQDWVFSCNVADAPSTAVFLAESVPTNLGSWTAGNNAGPFKCGANETLVVLGFALLPNVTYQCTIIGEAVTSGKSSNVFPYPSTSTVVTQNQAGLKTITLAINGAGVIGTGIYTANNGTQAFAYSASTGATYQTFTTSQSIVQAALIKPGQITGVACGATTVSSQNYTSVQRINTTTGTTIATSTRSTTAGLLSLSWQWLMSPDGSYVIYYCANSGNPYWLYQIATDTWTINAVSTGATTDYFQSNMTICPGYPNTGYVAHGNLAQWRILNLVTGSNVQNNNNTTNSTQIAFNATGTYFFTTNQIFTVTAGVPNFSTTPTTVSGYSTGPYTSPPVSNSAGTIMYNLGADSLIVKATTLPGAVCTTVGSFPSAITQIQIDSGNANIYGMTTGGQIYSMNISTGVVTTLAAVGGDGFFNLSTSSGNALATPPTGYAYRILTVTAYGSGTGTIALSTDSSFTTSNFCVMANNTTQLLNGRLVNKPIYVTSSAAGISYVEIAYDLVFYDLTTV